MDEIKHVNDIDPGILFQIQLLLKEDGWQNLLKVSSINSSDFSRYVEKTETGKNKQTNLARTLLEYCANVPVDDFIKWLEIIRLEEALLLLKEDEPLKIIVEPDRIIEVTAGNSERLVLSCKAQGFPTPKYQWFCNEVKLSEDSVLEISPVRFEDAGSYYCHVSNISRCGIETSVYTCGTKVVVHPPKVNNLPKIVQQPYSPTTEKIIPGNTFTLTCQASSEYPLSYQWCCNGIILEGKIGPQLKIKTHSNEVCGKWRIECIVSNKHGCVVSNSIILELECEDEEFHATDKFALLIGNNEYDYLPCLPQPAHDVLILSQLLQSIGFKTFCFQNLTCKEMRQAIKMFSDFLGPGVYELFYFGGHGYEQSGQYRLLGKEIKDIVKDDSISPDEILDCMQQQNPEVNVILLDTCRQPSSEPDASYSIPVKRFKSGVLRNTIFGYATSFPYGSYEIEGHCSIFVQYLQMHITECIPIWNMLLKVLKDVETDPASSVQFPSLAGSLSGSLKLTDSIIKQGELYDRQLERYKSITGMPKEKVVPLCDIGISITLTFSLYKNTFCNAMTINMYIASLSGCKDDDHTGSLEFYNATSICEKQPTSTNDKIKPAFSVSLFNIQCQEIIKGKLNIYSKEKRCICYFKDFCITPIIAKILK